MFVSMTGFGNSEHNFSWGTVKFEISSINHKYQDFSTKLPRELASLENRIINIMRNNINRGKVRLSAEINFYPGSEIGLVNEKALINIYNQVCKISRENNIEIPRDLTQFLLIPGVVDNTACESSLEDFALWDNLVLKACDSLKSMKISEGEKLFKQVQQEINNLSEIVKRLKERWQIAINDAIESLRSRIQNVMEHYKLEIDESRIAQEVSLMSDRWDVTEELTRMNAHIEKFSQIMNSNESNGKKLDFLVQEMNREINTMGAKVNDAIFRWDVVEGKSCVEKIREQLQNIE